MRWFFLLFGVLLANQAVIAANVATLPPEASKKHQLGQKIYVKNCSACHGDNGNTAVWARGGLNPPPRDFTSAAAKEELSRERMLTSVTHGRPGTAMMPFASRLSPDEIEAVVDFVRAQFMMPSGVPSTPNAVSTPSQSVVAKTTVDSNLAFPNALAGNKEKGREFFLNNCYVCHGKTGEGNGPRAHFNQPRPRNFTSDDTRANFNRPRLFDSIKNGKPGTVMPAWGKVLSDQQIADVAEFVFTEFIRPQADKKKI